MKVQVSLPNSQQKGNKQVPNSTGTIPASKRPSASAKGHGSPRQQHSTTSVSASGHSSHSTPLKPTQNFTLASQQSTASESQQQKQIALLKQEIEQLNYKLVEAQQKEQQQKDMYETMIAAMQGGNQSASENYVSGGSSSHGALALIDSSLTKPAAQANNNEYLLDKINTLQQKLDETQKYLQETENSLKLLQKDYDFTQKDSQTVINHLRLDNARLRDQLQTERDRASNELQLLLEDQQDKESVALKLLQEKFDQQLSDLKHMHLTEKMSLQQDQERLKSELKFLRLEHSELITNTNVSDQLQNLHEEYLNEIQLLNQQITLKSQETLMLIETMDREKQNLIKRISELEVEVSKQKESKDKIKAEASKKTQDMKDKLEIAFQQLTANDEAAGELQILRSQIKAMQEKLEVSSSKVEQTSQNVEEQAQNSVQVNASKEIEKVESIAKNLQIQIGALMNENKKLRTELKHSVNTARSASPPAQLRKMNSTSQDESFQQQSKKKGRGGKQGSPQVTSHKSQDAYYAGSSNQKKQSATNNSRSGGFLNSQRMKKSINTLNDLNTSSTMHQEGYGSGSLQNSPSNEILNSSKNAGGATARVYQKASLQQQQQQSANSKRQQFFQKNSSNNLPNEFSSMTLNTTAITGGQGIDQSIYGKGQHSAQNRNFMNQSLSSNQLFGGLGNQSQMNNTVILQKLTSNIDSIKCGSCLLQFGLEEFLTHQCLDNDDTTGLTLSPIKSRNKLQRLHSVTSEGGNANGQKQSMLFERIKKPREDDSTNGGYLEDLDVSTEIGGGFKASHYGGAQGHMMHGSNGGNHLGPGGSNGVNQRPSFLSSVDYNSFMNEKSTMNGQNYNIHGGSTFSPEDKERQGGGVGKQQMTKQKQNQQQMASVNSKVMKHLEDRIKYFETMFRQAQENVHRLNGELRKRDIENEKLILDLKQTKIHIALLEETSAQREFHLKNEISSLRQKEIQSSSSGQPEITVKLHTTNVSCFNLGYTSTANTHELKIEPSVASLAQKQLEQPTLLQQTASTMASSKHLGLRTPPINKSVKFNQETPIMEEIYQETAPSSGHYRQLSRKDLGAGAITSRDGGSNSYGDMKRVAPKRMRSMDKEISQTSSTMKMMVPQKDASYQPLSLRHQYSQSFHQQQQDDNQQDISQDVQPEGKPSIGKRHQQPYISKLQKGLGSPKMMTQRGSPKNNMAK